MRRQKAGHSTWLLKQSTYKAPLRYFFVVVAGFGLDYLAYATLVTLGETIYLANLVGFCLGAACNVVLIRRYVFPKSRFKFSTDLLLTILANGGMLAVGMVILWVLVDGLGLNPYGAKLIANGLTFILNYVTRTTFFRMK